MCVTNNWIIDAARTTLIYTKGYPNVMKRVHQWLSYFCSLLQGTKVFCVKGISWLLLYQFFFVIFVIFVL